MKRVLITGSAAQIGKVLRAGLQGRYRLRLADIAPQAAAGAARKSSRQTSPNSTRCCR